MPRYRKKQPQLRHRMKKAVLNTTCVKKRDRMISYSNTSPLGNSTPTDTIRGNVHVRGGTAGVSTGNGALFIWSPTARPINDNTNSENTRASRDVYHKGYLERLLVETNSGAPFFWRRIVVESKAPFQFSYSADTTIDPPPRIDFDPWLDNPGGGMARFWYNQFGNKSDPSDNRISTYIADMYGQLFAGAANIDWHDTQTAKVDTDRFTLKYDRVRIIRSGNAEGAVSRFNFYLPMEATMYYDHDETGGGTSIQSYQATQAKKGMGNLYIIDIIEGGFSSDDTDVLRITPESCAYWHER